MTKILVVDDDSAINELIKINLELQGYEVIQAFNGVEGFAKAKQEEPSLIVLDVMMPEVDGYKINALFDKGDLPDYQAHDPQNCPLCKANMKLDAIVNSYGYSKI